MDFLNKFTQGDNNNQNNNQQQQEGQYGGQQHQNQGYGGQQQQEGQYGNQQQHNQQSSSGGIGGFLGGLGGGSQNQNRQQGNNQQGSSSGGGGFLGGLGEKFNQAAGGGRESEKNEDFLDKGVDFVQEKFMGAGPQDNESAIEQAKDEQISDMIRKQYKDRMGSDIPIKDKETRF